MQGNNPGPGAYGSQPQAMNVGQPQQPVHNPQGQQQVRFRAPMTSSNQQGQSGSTSFTGVGFGRGAPSYGSGTGGTGVSQCVNTEAFLVLRTSFSQLVGSGQTHLGTQEWEEADNQVVTKETLLSVVAESYFQDQQHFRERSYTYRDNTFIIQRVMNQRITQPRNLARTEKSDHG